MRVRIAVLLALATAPGCYDSQWGQQKAAQQRGAVSAAPAALHTGEPVAGREGPNDPSSPPSRNASAHVQTLRVRALVTRSFTAHVVDAPHHLRDLLEDANRITERDLGVHLELAETRAWEPANEENLDKAFDALRAKDPGDGVDWVVGFVGALPRATRSFHEAGKGALVGKHLVVRAPSSAERHDSIEKSFDELPEEQRRDLRKRLSRHRAVAVFLHEMGHTLGSVHETEPQSIMFPEYNPKMAAFGPSANDVMRAAVSKHGASDSVVAREIAGALERAPEGAFVAAERTQLLKQLEATMARAAPGQGGQAAQAGQAASAQAAPGQAAQAGATDGGASPASPSAAADVKAAEPFVPETPELAGADRERFADAYRAAARGDVVGSWNTAKPLFAAYPRSMGVQDLRCQVASRSMRFELVRRECEPLMKLSTAPPAK